MRRIIFPETRPRRQFLRRSFYEPSSSFAASVSVGVVSGERGFFKLKLIKASLRRSQLWRGRGEALCGLSLMSIRHELSAELD